MKKQTTFLKNELFEGIMSKEEYLTFEHNDLINKEGCVLIAIHDPDSPVHPDDRIQGFDDVLQIQFWDLEQSQGDLFPITEIQGSTLYKFILKNESKRFLIHCSAGISRSAGVGLAVECCVLFYDSKRDYAISKSPIKEHYRYSPNLKVYDTIL